MVKQCGPQLALVIPDARAERTKPQVTFSQQVETNSIWSVVCISV